MAEGALAPTDSRGMWDWIKDNLLSWFLPSAFVGLGAGLLSDKFGDDVPEWAKPITTFLAGIWNWFINLFRGFIAKEEIQAEKGMAAQITNARVFEQAATEVEVPELAARLRTIMTARINADTGMNMTVNHAYALTQAKAVYNEVYAKVTEALIERNPKYEARDGSPDRVRFHKTAKRYAQAISGIDDPEVPAEDINYTTHNTGYLGMLLRTQRDVAAKTDKNYTAAEVQPFNAQVAAAAAAAAPPPTVTGGQTPPLGGSNPDNPDSGLPPKPPANNRLIQ